MRIWNEKLKECKISPIMLRRRNKRIEINCLALADNFAILSEHLTSAVTQVNFLEDIASRTGLRISAEKNKFLTNIKNAPNFLVTDIGRIEMVTKFKYIEEIIKWNGCRRKDS